MGLWEDIVAANPNTPISELIIIFERQATATPPTDLAVLERSVSAASHAMYTLHLQRRRLGSEEPEDKEFLFRFWADLEFFILTLWHLRNAGLLGRRVAAVATQLQAALDLFDSELSNLRTMRNVIEHLEDYGVDVGRAPVSRRQLRIGSWDGTIFRWLNAELNVDMAMVSAAKLYEAIRKARASI